MAGTYTQQEKFKVIENGAATTILRHEHEAVLGVLNSLERAVYRLKSGKEVPPDFIDLVLEFLTIFVDKCHHTKEEEVLFPLLGEAGIPVEGGPIGCMLGEHEEGRDYIRRMKNGLNRWQAGDNSGQTEFCKAAEGYIYLLRQHIMKENQVLFVLADSVLPGRLQQETAEKFELIETEKLGVGTHERLHGVIDELERQSLAWQ
jgi:hemerythrin-like domain-containing protein